MLHNRSLVAVVIAAFCVLSFVVFTAAGNNSVDRGLSLRYRILIEEAYNVWSSAADRT
jgi:hypothetical protein